ncbi:MAG: ROK family protein [Planctomycetota bacterium]
MPDADSANRCELFFGIDVGGTDVKLGLVDASGHVHARHRVPTAELVTPSRVFSFAMDYARHEASKLGCPLIAVGLAVPGVLDTESFELREVVNLHGWLGVPLRDQLREVSKLPTSVINDANSAAFAEHAARDLGEKSLALVTLGTGVGCGVVFSGRAHGGDHGCAGELGHIAIDFAKDAPRCTCGSRGHLECYAGARGVVNRLRAAIEQAEEPVPSELASDEVTPRIIADYAEQGNAICRAIVDETAEYVGRAVGLMGQVADPAVVLLGGAMTFGGSQTETGRRFLDKVRDAVKATTLVQVGGNMQIDFATLGADAGMLGAAMVARQEASQHSF